MKLKEALDNPILFDDPTFDEIERMDSKDYLDKERENALTNAIKMYGDKQFFYTVHPRSGNAYNDITLLIRFKQNGPIYWETFRSTFREPILSNMAYSATTKNFRKSLETYSKLKADKSITHYSKKLDDPNEPLPLDIAIPTR